MPRLLEREIPRVWVRVSLLALTGAFCLLMGISIAWIRHLSRDLPSPAVIQEIAPSLKTLVLSARGDTIHEFFRENRAIVALPRIPLRLQQAVVAIEDRRFYDHYGVDARRIVKIIWVNLTSRSRPGASTLTQQLARNLFLTPEKTVSRKLKEIILALQIEQTYTKDEILAMYLNQIYLGRGAYGVQAAARTYFGKDVRDLADPELTLLAGLIQNPGRFNPFTHADAAYRRRAIVLQSMVETGSLTREKAEEIGRTQVRLADPDDVLNHVDFGGYFFEEVRQHLERRYGVAALYEGGLRVTTTLDPAAQRFMEQAVERHLTRFEKDFGYRHSRARYLRQIEAEEAGARPVYLQCAALLMDSQTGAVLGMVGGRSFRESKFNRAVQARRQPGSVFKPFVYLAAIERGYTPASILMDTPVVIDTGAGLWRPQNYSGKFEGPVTLRYALSHSINCPTARFYLDFGLSPVLDAARGTRHRQRSAARSVGVPRRGRSQPDRGGGRLRRVRRPGYPRRTVPHLARGDGAGRSARGERSASAGGTRPGNRLHHGGSAAEHAARGHRRACRPVRLPRHRRRQDRHDERLHRRLVRRLHPPPLRRRLGRLRRQGHHGAQEDRRRHGVAGVGRFHGKDRRQRRGRSRSRVRPASRSVRSAATRDSWPRPAARRPAWRCSWSARTPGSSCSRHPGPLLDASRMRETPPPPAADEAPEDPEAHDLPDPPG